MKQWLTLVVVAVPVLLGAGIPKGPYIKVPEVRHDFGTVKAGDRPEHFFTIENGGTEELVILKVQSS